MKPEDDKTQTHTVLTKGAMVSHYRIVEKIGAGGMGEVYLAEDIELNRQVALKFLPPHLCQDEDCRARFKREAQAVAKLNHPHVITLHEVSEYQGRPFFAMELVEGQSLRELSKGGELSFDRIIELAIQICDGLGAAHEKQIIHRDIKPSNIVIDAYGRPKILDFGLAAVRGGEHLTKTGSTLGTVRYMAPEQVRAKEVDHRSDLFSLGVVLYELITGHSPFARDNDMATGQAILGDTPEPLAKYRSNIQDELQRTVSKLLEKDPSMRYQSAAGVISDLKRLIAPTPSSIAMTPTAKRSRWLLWAGLGAVAVAVLIVGLFFRPNDPAPDSDSVKTIAVLPFENLGAPEDEYFADGMTDEITSRLAGIQGLGVISRTSAMKYKYTDKSLGEIGSELGVDYVLEGTVRWSKDGEHSRVRITPQLIRVADDRHLWADNYERELMGVFEVQSDIALQIVDHLGVTLFDSDRRAINVKPTENPDAYEYYLKGMTHFNRMSFTSGPIRLAIAMFDSAITLDTSFALAYAAKSVSHSLYYFANFEDFAKHAELARQAAQRALSLAPDLSYAHLSMGNYYNFVKRDYERAMQEFSRARSELHSNDKLLISIAYVKMRQGLFAEALEYFQEAATLDPLTATKHLWLARAFGFTRQYDEAERALNRAIWLDKTRPDFYADKVRLYAAKYGDLEKMRQVVVAAREFVDPSAIVSDWFWEYDLVDEPLDTLLAKYIRDYRELEAPSLYYGKVAAGYRAIEQSEMAAAYDDSARISIEEHLKQAPDDAELHSILGWTMACLGDFEAAIEEGQRGKELLSVDDCHW